MTAPPGTEPRSPRRPTPIGLSLIRLLDTSGGEIHFAGVE